MSVEGHTTPQAVFVCDTIWIKPAALVAWQLSQLALYILMNSRADLCEEED